MNSTIQKKQTKELQQQPQQARTTKAVHEVRNNNNGYAGRNNNNTNNNVKTKGKITPFTKQELKRQLGRRAYRGRFEIARVMLEALPCTKTQLMYNCMLSFTQLNEYLDYLTKHGLIEVSSVLLLGRAKKGKPLYNVSITAEGRRVLRVVNELFAMLFGEKSGAKSMRRIRARIVKESASPLPPVILESSNISGSNNRGELIIVEAKAA